MKISVVAQRQEMNIKWKLLSRLKIDINTGCWEWQGCKDGKGYGQCKFYGVVKKVHRLSAMIFLDFDLNSKLLVCHHCDNPPCINPDHFFIGTNADNMRDSRLKGRQKKSEEQKKKISKTRIGFKPSKKHKKKISQSAKQRFKNKYNHPFYGKKHTEETKIKMSISRKKYIENNSLLPSS